jgi:two-component system sensor histidine kinase/response regulator
MTRYLQSYAKFRFFLLVGVVIRLLGSTPVWAAHQGPFDGETGHEKITLTSRPVPLNPEARLQYGRRLLEANKQGSHSEQALAYRIMASAYQELRDYNQATHYFQRALLLHQQLRSPQDATIDLFYLGGALLVEGDTGKARSTYQQALQGFSRLRYPAGIAQVHEKLGALYAQQRKWPQALASHSRALSGWQHQQDSVRMAATLNAVGGVYYEQRFYSRALFYFRKALQTVRPASSLPRSESMTGIGWVYLAIGNDEAALASFTRAEQLFPPSASPLQHARLYQYIAATQDSLGNWPEAEQALRRSLGFARQSNSKAQLSVGYRALAALYRHTGSYRQSLDAMTRFTELQDSVFAEERSAQVAELRTRYETEKKEREIQLLTKDRQIQQANLRRQKLQRNALAVGALLLLIIIAVLYRSRRQQAHVNKLLERKNAAINRQKEELGRINRTKDTLFSIISHDLRSPLSSLYSLLSLLSMGSLPPERLALHSVRLTRVLNNTLLLLDNLLNWSAAQMKDDKIRPEQLRLDVLVEEAVALLLGDAERKSILLVSQVPVPTLVRADVNMTRLVLRNLLGNAIKFTPEGGSVTVTATPQGTMCSIAVQDTGVGIQAADFDKVFGKTGPFTTPGTARENGTGLGLQLCKDFVERNGGQLSFSSQTGQGTTFVFTLPAAFPDPTLPQDALITAAAAAE